MGKTLPFPGQPGGGGPTMPQMPQGPPIEPKTVKISWIEKGAVPEIFYNVYDISANDVTLALKGPKGATILMLRDITRVVVESQAVSVQ